MILSDTGEFLVGGAGQANFGLAGEHSGDPGVGTGGFPHEGKFQLFVLVKLVGAQQHKGLRGVQVENADIRLWDTVGG